MSVAREAAGRSSTSAGSPAGWSVVRPGSEKVAAEEVGGVRPLHVRPGVDDYVPGPAGRWIGQVEGGPRVRHALAVCHDRVEGECNPAPRLAAAEMDVRDVDGLGLQASDPQLQGGRARGGREADGPAGLDA